LPLRSITPTLELVPPMSMPRAASFLVTIDGLVRKASGQVRTALVR
jgi:hypothetical protein